MTVQCPSIGCCSVGVLSPSDRVAITRAVYMSTHAGDKCTHDNSITLLQCVVRFVTRVMSRLLARRAIRSAAICRMHTNVTCSIWFTRQAGRWRPRPEDGFAVAQCLTTYIHIASVAKLNKVILFLWLESLGPQTIAG